MIYVNLLAPVAQLDRALGYGPGGSGFDLIGKNGQKKTR